MTALSIWGPYALRRSVNKFSSSALGKINNFFCSRLFVSLQLGYSVQPHATDDGFLGIGNNPIVGAEKRQGCATQLRYRS